MSLCLANAALLGLSWWESALVVCLFAGPMLLGVMDSVGLMFSPMRSVGCEHSKLSSRDSVIGAIAWGFCTDSWRTDYAQDHKTPGGGHSVQA